MPMFYANFCQPSSILACSYYTLGRCVSSYVMNPQATKVHRIKHFEPVNRCPSLSGELICLSTAFVHSSIIFFFLEPRGNRPNGHYSAVLAPWLIPHEHSIVSNCHSQENIELSDASVQKRTQGRPEQHIIIPNLSLRRQYQPQLFSPIPFGLWIWLISLLFGSLFRVGSSGQLGKLLGKIPRIPDLCRRISTHTRTIPASETLPFLTFHQFV
ncbi:hypothetical protein F4779DRAFT_596744 [Xylariaceae sp. FL0662B]|nr:hypothetical protein F4779DRAFT_596744 [Xylariaceae sp. FL0662B]